MRIRDTGNNIEKKQWLWQYSELIEEIQRQKQTASFFLEQATGLSATKINISGIRANGPKNSVEMYYLYCDDCAKECLELMKKARKQKKLISKAINNLENTNHRRVLSLRYLDQMEFIEIAKQMKYTRDHIHSLHNEALEELVIIN